MKIVFLIALLLFVLPTIGQAQIANEGFEEWTVESRSGKPVGWRSSSYGIGKDSSAHSGNFAASVWTWYTYAPGYILNDTSGQTQHFALGQGGTPIDFLPEKLTGFYKFSRGDAPDSAFGTAVAIFRRYNSIEKKSDTISFAKALLEPSAEWRPFEMAIPHSVSGLAPDTVVIGFFSTDPTRDDRIVCNLPTDKCCYLSVDDVALVTTSGVSYTLDQLLAPARVIPNPVVESDAALTFNAEAGKTYRVRVYSAAGSLAAEMETVSSRVSLSNLHLSSGSYFITVVDGANLPVGNGRFVVE